MILNNRNLTSQFTAAERWQSLKAAALAGIGAGVGAVLLLLAHRVQALGWGEGIASLGNLGFSGWAFWVSGAIAALSGALMGITYRYAVRRDDNPQLKSGVVAAFSLVRGLAQVDVGSALAQGGWPFLGAIAESLLIFGLAGLLLDFTLSKGWLKPFGQADSLGKSP